MTDQKKTKAQLIAELEEARATIKRQQEQLSFYRDFEERERRFYKSHGEVIGILQRLGSNQKAQAMKAYNLGRMKGKQEAAGR